jgi:hypothetical protein
MSNMYIKLEKPTGQSSMDNPETRKMLGTRHRTNTKNKKNQHRKDKYRVDTHNSQKIRPLYNGDIIETTKLRNNSDVDFYIIFYHHNRLL